MSQIDKVIYLPLLTWYWILFIFFYFLIFSYFLSFFFYVYRVRLLSSKKISLILQFQIFFLLNIWNCYKNFNKFNFKILCFRR